MIEQNGKAFSAVDFKKKENRKRFFNYGMRVCKRYQERNHRRIKEGVHNLFEKMNVSVHHVTHF